MFCGPKVQKGLQYLIIKKKKIFLIFLTKKIMEIDFGKVLDGIAKANSEILLSKLTRHAYQRHFHVGKSIFLELSSTLRGCNFLR